MARDKKRPVRFNLPDNDMVDLIPWAYVVDKFETILNPVIDSISGITSDIHAIDLKVQEWLETQEQ